MILFFPFANIPAATNIHNIKLNFLSAYAKEIDRKNRKTAFHPSTDNNRTKITKMLETTRI